MEDFVLDKSLLSEEEQNEILFALQGLSATQAVEGKALSRLSGLFQKKSVDWIDVDFSHWGSDAEEREKFQLIKTAILEHRILKFTYYSSYGQDVYKRQLLISQEKRFLTRSQKPVCCAGAVWEDSAVELLSSEAEELVLSVTFIMNFTLAFTPSGAPV